MSHGHRGCSRPGCSAACQALRWNPYNKDVAAKTVHVYRSNGAWAVKKEGESARTFSTQREAVDAARASVKSERTGQFVVHGKNGEIRDYETHGMIRIQDPPKKSRMAGRIGR